MKTLWQILAIARSEFRFGLRRGAPVVVTALIGLIVGAAILLDPIANLDNMRSEELSASLSQEQMNAWAEVGVTVDVFRSLDRDSMADMAASSTVSGWFLMFLSLLFLPIASAGVIPSDRQFGVMELMRSTPVKGTTYLAGKILGILGIVLFIALFPFLLFFAVLEGILLNVFQTGIPLYLIGFYFKLAILDGIPLLACGATIGVLAGITFRSRRAALFPGLLAGMAGTFAWIRLFQAPGTFSNSIDQAAVFVFQGYQSISQASWARILGPDAPSYDLNLLGADVPVVGIGQVLVMYAVILAVLFILAVFARLLLQWKENF